MTTSAPVVVDDRAAGRFEVLVDGQVAGYAEYRRRGPSVAFTHTVVEPEFEGRGVGSALARGALDAVRAEGASVLPFCPFIRSWIQRHPGYADLVPEARRAQFGLAPG
ncbi:N-acetyltransferase [Blastococcus sp. MG754426]|uniref:GNAT family N-acetyltransferase n=3 Tax=Blastococcus TaxID=38501 RepID=UPI001EF05A79|nr:MULTISPECIES: GNAT family N-acetyltransferase [unclassified Blastococcus]MCF6506463.1 N-acetyltransferase [Blastococcus sp. MG754426]MCF6511252.1 N-acetyltransferase [Blastococcus sp. MG754427]